MVIAKIAQVAQQGANECLLQAARPGVPALAAPHVLCQRAHAAPARLQARQGERLCPAAGARASGPLRVARKHRRAAAAA